MFRGAIFSGHDVFIKVKNVSCLCEQCSFLIVVITCYSILWIMFVFVLCFWFHGCCCTVQSPAAVEWSGSVSWPVDWIRPLNQALVSSGSVGSHVSSLMHGCFLCCSWFWLCLVLGVLHQSRDFLGRLSPLWPCNVSSGMLKHAQLNSAHGWCGVVKRLCSQIDWTFVVFIAVCLFVFSEVEQRWRTITQATVRVSWSLVHLPAAWH